MGILSFCITFVLQFRSEMSQLIEDLKWRYATKKYNPTQKISNENLEILKNVLSLVPSSNGLQPFKFLIIENSEIRQQLRGKSWNQSQITDASHLIVLCSFLGLNEYHIDTYMELNAKVRSLAPATLEPFSSHLKKTVITKSEDEQLAVNEKQTYIALGHLLHAAAHLRIDASPMEGFSVEGYDEVLGLSAKNLKATVVCALGYRSDDDAFQHFKKVRKSHEDLFEII